MNKKRLSFLCLSLAASLGFAGTSYAQGSSDPGLSTVGAMRSGAGVVIVDDVMENHKAQLSVGHTFAEGERGTNINIPTLEGRIPVLDHGYFDFKLPIYAAKGELASVAGLGDASVTYTHHWYNLEQFSFQATGGFKLGMGNSTITDGSGRPLPMTYQSSLGTTDLMIGANVMWKKYVTLAAGYQQPIIRYTENDYLRMSPANELSYSTVDYPLSRKLYRNGDVMMRLEGHYSGERAGISAGPWAIYHLANDLYQDETGRWRELNGSEGFTLNVAGNAYIRWGRLGEWKFDVTAALPVVKRDIAPDGLTRQWMVTPRLTYFFGQQVLMF
jgi:hypothetical protein